MKRQQFYLPRSGKLVTQLPRGITFAYDLRLGRSRDHWKGPTEEYNVECFCQNNMMQKIQLHLANLTLQLQDIKKCIDPGGYRWPPTIPLAQNSYFRLAVFW